jgi:hypothetical protein
MGTFQIPLGALLRFLAAAFREYRDIPFHNWNSAVDPAQFAFWELSLAREALQLDKLVAAICHDIEHEGRDAVANDKAAIPLLILSPDEPVLQTMHCSATVKLPSQPNCNIIAGLDAEQASLFWAMLVDCIFGPDVGYHQKLLDEAEAKLKAGNGAFDVGSPAGKMLLMRLLVKCAVTALVARALDISLPGRAFSSRMHFRSTCQPLIHPQDSLTRSPSQTQ